MKNTLKTVITTGVTLAAVAGATAAMASTGSGTGGFSDLLVTVKDWTTGDFGKVLSILFVLIGIAAGVARQNLMPFAVGGGAGVGLNAAPGIIENSIFQATVATGQVVEAVQPIANSVGLM